MFILHYKAIDYDPETRLELLQLFGERGHSIPVIGHYSTLSPGEGFVIYDTNDMEALYEEATAYRAYFDYEIYPVIPVEMATAITAKALAG